MALEHSQFLEAMSIVQHYLNDLLNEMKESSSESIRWVNVRKRNRISVIELETEAEITLCIKIPYVVVDSLDIQATQEMVIIKGEQLKPVSERDYYDLEFGGQFHKMIPLPCLIQPRAAISRINEDVVILTLQKSWLPRRQFKIKMLDQSETTSD